MKRLRKNVIAGNWKMNKTLPEVLAFVEEVKDLQTSEKVDAIVCAPFPYLAILVDKCKETNVKVAAQNMHQAESGAYTGEVSPVMLQDIGVTHVILGHSERREYFMETDESVNSKVKAAFAHDLTPIICVGESLAQREADETLPHIEAQVSKALGGLSASQVTQVIIAYEPIWAIGTGKTASNEDANEVCRHIRQVIGQEYDEQTSDKVVIQYGGSVKPDNIDALLQESDIDGALVGGASLEAKSFIQLVEAGNK